MSYNSSILTGMYLLDSRTFTSSTTYVLPALTKFVVVECIGAGGGGGGGGRQSTTSSASGGGGGGGGGYWREFLTSSELGGGGATVDVTIGAGGTGGSGNTNSGMSGSGTAGNAGGHSRFGTLYFPGSFFYICTYYMNDFSQAIVGLCPPVNCLSSHKCTLFYPL